MNPPSARRGRSIERQVHALATFLDARAAIPVTGLNFSGRSLSFAFQLQRFVSEDLPHNFRGNALCFLYTAVDLIPAHVQFLATTGAMLATAQPKIQGLLAP